jgi:hypothetical protein
MEPNQIGFLIGEVITRLRRRYRRKRKRYNRHKN